MRLDAEHSKVCRACVVSTEYCARCSQKQRLRAAVKREGCETVFEQQQGQAARLAQPSSWLPHSSHRQIQRHLHKLEVAVRDGSARMDARQQAEASALRQRKVACRAPIVCSAVLDDVRRVQQLAKAGRFEEAKQLQEEVVAPQQQRAAAKQRREQAQQRSDALVQLRGQHQLERRSHGRKAAVQLQMLELQALRLPSTCTGPT